ncbi:MAG: hypothetical protein A2W09_00300 [Deltaproteobacteria bacterium RBG_16_50_11]|nr:MAG: hypothetical protein A2W09_00300 [Deltaproteobacteria bacterium RBG_16_50_11]
MHKVSQRFGAEGDTHSSLRRNRPTAQALLLWGIIIMLIAATTVGLNLSRAWSAEPEIVARVNGQPVPRSELQRTLSDPGTLRQFQQEHGVREMESKELERSALQKLINCYLLLQEADRRNITVTEQDLDQALIALRRSFKDLRDFGMWMKERGLDDKSLFETIRVDMVIKRVTGELVKDVRPTEKEVQDYYAGHKEDLTIGVDVRLRIIVVKSQAAAEEILAALRKGENFSRLARARSLGPHAAQGGDMGWVNFQALPPPLQRAVGMLKAGDVSGPLQKNIDEFLIVGLEGQRPVRAKSLAEARPEIERRLLPSKQQEVIQGWLGEQNKNSKIEVYR